jgi:hypothetical protein
VWRANPITHILHEGYLSAAVWKGVYLGKDERIHPRIVELCFWSLFPSLLFDGGCHNCIPTLLGTPCGVVVWGTNEAHLKSQR